MSKRSNRTRGGRVLSRGTALRARQMKPIRTGRGGSIEADLDTTDPAVFPIWTESAVDVLTEDGSLMVIQ